MLPPTLFIDPTAVETWDASVRWREDGELRDVTVDDTWWRVAQAVAAANGAQAPLWAHRYVDAFSQWRLLPDARLLRCAGTGERAVSADPPAAVLNVAAFVHAPFGGAPEFDRALFADTAALAVRLLDDALLTCDGFMQDAGLRIGLIGFEDALRKLRIPYLSHEAIEQAAVVGRALAEGCLRGSADLAEERGRADPHDGHELATLVATRARSRDLPDWLIARVQHTGVRHATLTAIRCQPLLAQLANGASDALDPLPLAMSANGGTTVTLDTAHAGICQAIQPWIDLPIEPPQPHGTSAGGDTSHHPSAQTAALA